MNSPKNRLLQLRPQGLEAGENGQVEPSVLDLLLVVLYILLLLLSYNSINSIIIIIYHYLSRATR